MIRPAFFFFPLLFTLAVSAQPLDTAHWVTNGPVHALQSHNGKLYLGGDFDQVSPRTGPFIPTDETTGSVFPWPVVNGEIYVIEPDGHGGCYVGGNFTRVSNYSISCLFHLDSLGQLDTLFHPNPGGSVYCILLRDSILYFAGDFTHIEDGPRLRGACMDVLNDSISPWDPEVNGPIYDMMIDPAFNDVIVVGAFTSVSGVTRHYLAKINGVTGGLYGFPGPYGPAWNLPPPNGPIRAIEPHPASGKVFIGGDFTNIGVSNPGVAALSYPAGILISYSPNVQGQVYDLKVRNGKLYLAGSFANVGGFPRQNLACVDVTNASLQPWTLNTNGLVRSLRADSSLWYIAGDFTLVGGQPRYRIAVADTAAVPVLQAYAPMINNSVYAAFRLNGKLYLGGTFTGTGGYLARNLCRLDLGSGQADPWIPTASDAVRTLALNGNTLYVAGDFSSIQFQPRDHLCAFDLTNDQLLPLDPGCSGLVRAFAFKGDTVFAGGGFGSFGGQNRNNLAAFSFPSGALLGWNASVSGTVNALRTESSGLVVAGYFSHVSGYPRNNIARVSYNSSTPDQFWMPDVDDGIYTLEEYGGRYYLGGWFRHIDGQPFEYLHTIDAAGGAAGSFSGQVDNYVRLLHRSGNTLFAHGAFQSVQSGTSNGYTAYDLPGGTILPFNPLVDGTGNAMHAVQNKLYLGGQFKLVNGILCSNLAVFDISGVTGAGEEMPAEKIFLSLYPNPADDAVRIVFPQAEDESCIVLVRDVTGKIVLRFEDVRVREFSVPLGGLAAGVYAIECSSARAHACGRLVKR